jgi:hypothetical protein
LLKKCGDPSAAAHKDCAGAVTVNCQPSSCEAIQGMETSETAAAKMQILRPPSQARTVQIGITRQVNRSQHNNDLFMFSTLKTCLIAFSTGSAKMTGSLQARSGLRNHIAFVSRPERPLARVVTRIERSRRKPWPTPVWLIGRADVCRPESAPRRRRR